MNAEKVDAATGSATDLQNEMERPNDDNAGQNDVEMRSSLNDLPDEILRKIIMSLDGRDWPRMEAVSRRFQLCVLDCWRSLKVVLLEEFCDHALIFWKSASEKQDLLKRRLRLVHDRSPNMQSISGFSAFVSELDSRTLEYVTHFQFLKSVTFSDCIITAAQLASFLNDSNNRNGLEELCVIESLVLSTYEIFMNWNRYGNIHRNRNSNAEDELLLQAFLSTPDRPALRLRKLRYENNNCCKGSFLASLDTSRLEILSLADRMINWRYVTELLGRCMELQEFRFDGMMADRHVIVISQSVEDFLNAVVSMPTISLRRLELRGCESDDDLLPAVLCQLGRRHDRLESLSVHDNDFSPVQDRRVPVTGEYFPNLTVLEIDVASVGKGELAQLMTRMGRLKELGFYYSDPLGFHYLHPPDLATPEDKERIVDGDVVRAIVYNIEGLTSLRLYQVVITPENAKMLTEMKELREVSIHWADVGEEAITWWCDRFGPMIIRLEMYSPKLTDSLILHMVSRLIRVRRLLLGANNITDTALHLIGISCPNMEELLLGYAGTGGKLIIAESGVQALMDNCKKLTYLELCNADYHLHDIVMNNSTRLVDDEDMDIRKRLFWASSYCMLATHDDDDDDDDDHDDFNGDADITPGEWSDPESY